MDSACERQCSSVRSGGQAQAVVLLSRQTPHQNEVGYFANPVEFVPTCLAAHEPQDRLRREWPPFVNQCPSPLPSGRELPRHTRPAPPVTCRLRRRSSRRRPRSDERLPPFWVCHFRPCKSRQRQQTHARESGRW